MGGSHVGGLIMVALGVFNGHLVEAEKDVFGVNQCDDAVEIDGAAETIVEPEKGRKVPWVGETAGLKNDIVKCTAAGDERFDGCYAGISRKSWA